nr:trehalose-phosphatase [uncultured Psychrobacter sp.]
MTLSSKSTPIYLAPDTFAEYLSYQNQYCLFLDIDGTLATFTLDPKDSFIPSTTLNILQQIQDLGVDIAVVTGRSLDNARTMLFPLVLPIAATHGLEIFTNKHSTGQTDDMTHIKQIDIKELSAIKQALLQACQFYPKVRIEDKPYSIALHFREYPALAEVAYSLITQVAKPYPNWVIKSGKYVWELVSQDANKGTAILTLLQSMQTDKTLCPIFIGDDSTDEAGFEAIQGDHKAGMGIKVGTEPTSAHYYVNDTDEVVTLLHRFFTFYQKQASLPRHLTESSPLNSPKYLGPSL